MINQRIGSFIAALRKEQNLTQEQFAEKLGVSNRSVSRWENGNTLPDLSLMENICRITGVTLPELLEGNRLDSSTDCRNSIHLILALWDREKLAKIRILNIWFALGLAFLITAILSMRIFSLVEIWVLVVLGVFFQALGFYKNNCDPVLHDVEKEILATSDGTASMRNPEELLAYVRKSQSVGVRQYNKAFRQICANLAEHERVSFAMVANEYSIDGAPGIWHCGIAVTQDRIFFCGETVAGRFMTRMVMDVYNKNDIRSIQCTNRSIVVITERATLIIKGENIRCLGDKFDMAIHKEVRF